MTDAIKCAFLIFLMLPTTLMIAETVAAQDSAEQKARMRARAALANLEAAARFECRYEYSLSDLRFDAHIRRDGARYYQAGQQFVAGQLSLAWEVAWDGSIATQRRSGRMLIVDRQPHMSWKNCPAPFEEVAGLLRNMGGSKRFVSGPTDLSGGDEIETVWLSNDGTVTTTIRQSRQVGWMPTWIEIGVQGQGGTITRLLDYRALEVSGNTVFLPMRQEQRSVFEEIGASVEMVLAIDPASFKVDPPFDRASFRLRSHRDDEVRDLQLMPAKAEAFDLEVVSEVGWPFAEVYQIEDELRREADLAARSPVAVGGGNPSGGRREPSEWKLPSTFLIIAGASVAVLAIVLRLRQRRRLTTPRA